MRGRRRKGYGAVEKKNSAEDWSPLLKHPTTSTRPDGGRVARWYRRGVLMLATGLQEPEAGSYTSAVVLWLGSPLAPPTHQHLAIRQKGGRGSPLPCSNIHLPQAPTSNPGMVRGNACVIFFGNRRRRRTSAQSQVDCILDTSVPMQPSLLNRYSSSRATPGTRSWKWKWKREDRGTSSSEILCGACTPHDDSVLTYVRRSKGRTRAPEFRSSGSSTLSESPVTRSRSSTVTPTSRAISMTPMPRRARRSKHARIASGGSSGGSSGSFRSQPCALICLYER